VKYYKINLEDFKPMYDTDYTYTFHSAGLEPWVCALLKQFKPRSVLDVGCGFDLWSLFLKGYLEFLMLLVLMLIMLRLSSLRSLVYMMSFMSQILEFFIILNRLISP